MRKHFLVTLSVALAACAGPAEEPAAQAEVAVAPAADAVAVPLTEVQEEGKGIFETVCWTCHGPAGRGDGPAVQAGSVTPPPTFHTRDYAESSAATLERRFRAGMAGADPNHPHMQYVSSLLRPESFREAPWRGRRSTPSGARVAMERRGTVTGPPRRTSSTCFRPTSPPTRSSPPGIGTRCIAASGREGGPSMGRSCRRGASSSRRGKCGIWWPISRHCSLARSHHPLGVTRSPRRRGSPTHLRGEIDRRTSASGTYSAAAWPPPPVGRSPQPRRVFPYRLR